MLGLDFSVTGIKDSTGRDGRFAQPTPRAATSVQGRDFLKIPKCFISISDLAAKDSLACATFGVRTVGNGHYLSTVKWLIYIILILGVKDKESFHSGLDKLKSRLFFFK